MCTLFIGKLGRHRRLCGWIMNKMTKHTDNMLIYICGYLTSVFSYLSSIFCFYWKSQHFRLTKWAMPNYSYSIYLNSICGKHHLPLLERWKIIVVMLVNSWKMTLTFWRQSFIEWIVFRSVSKTQMVTEFFFFGCCANWNYFNDANRYRKHFIYSRKFGLAKFCNMNGTSGCVCERATEMREYKSLMDWLIGCRRRKWISIVIKIYDGI